MPPHSGRYVQVAVRCVPLTSLLWWNQTTVKKQVHPSTFRLFAMRTKVLATFSAKSAVRDLLAQLLPLRSFRRAHREQAPRSSFTSVVMDSSTNHYIALGTDYCVVSLHLFNATSRFPFFDASDPQQMEVYWFILVYAHARKVTSLFTLYGTMTRGCLSVQNQRTLFPEPGLSLVKSVLWFFRSNHLFSS
jgi:hypothetical protein